MRIVCPGCAAEYDVPASRMAVPRKVRCARCGDEWLDGGEFEQPLVDSNPAEPNPAAEPHPPQEPDPVVAANAVLPPLTAMDRLSARPAPPPRSPDGLRVAWIMTAVALIAGVGAVVVWRAPLVRAWPPSSRLLGTIEPTTPAPAHGPAQPAEPAGHAKAKPVEPAGHTNE
jgi:predicted Zn finger-like uncharacterized protein